MYKAFHLLVPRAGLTPDDFRAGWDAYADALATMLRGAPGFRYYTRTPRTERVASLDQFHGHDYSFDGADALAFATAADAMAVRTSEAYAHGPGRLEAAFLDVAESTWLVAREHVFINGGPLGALDTGPGIKVITALRRLPGAAVDDFRDYWLEHGKLVQATAGISRYVQAHVVVEEYIGGRPRYDGLVEVWHRTLADQTATFLDPNMTVVQAEDIPKFIDTTTFFSIQCTDQERWVCGSR